MTRTLSRWTHRFPQFSDFDREFPRWMSEVFAPETNLRDFEFLPEANVSETDKAIEVAIDLPGMKPEEVKVELHDRTLTISGERKEEKEENGKTFHRVERRSGSFRRSFALPMEVDESKVEAKFEHGVLNIILPKTEKASPKKIEVKG